MSIRLQRRVLAVAAAGLLLAGCSARSEVTATDAGRMSTAAHTSTTIHARAAQTIELPGAAEGATPGLGAVATRQRLLPEVPEVIQLPDGTVGVKVAAQYFDTIVACRQPDGSFTTHCPPARERRP